MDDQTKEAISATAKKAERIAEEVVERPWVRAFSRIGFLAKGFLFLVIGLSAILLATGMQGGRITDPAGAMAAIAQYSAGKFLLTIFFIGALGHGVWNILRGIADVDGVGKGIKGIIARSASVGVGIFYFILAATAFTIVLTHSVSEENGRAEETVAWIFLSIPLGAVVILIVALGFWGVAIHECYSGISGKFQENYKTWKLTPAMEKFAMLLGVISFSTRAFLYVLVGYFFFLAANLNDPSQAQGIDGALLSLAQSRYGSILLLVSGFGLFCNGVLAFFEAKYRRIC
ncbi:MAG: DUF1206 domain-containing protein [bacterium]|nr:DUF1206 domain-containing protein [bacterium]